MTELLQCQAHSGYKSDGFQKTGFHEKPEKKAVSCRANEYKKPTEKGKAAHQMVSETSCISDALSWVAECSQDSCYIHSEDYFSISVKVYWETESIPGGSP